MPLTFARTSHRHGPYAGSSGIGAYYDPASKSVDGHRILYHSALSGLSARRIVYPHLPDETKNFTFDVHAPRLVASSQTLTSAHHAKYRQVLDDAVIQEIFRPDGGLSVPWDFIHRVEKMYLTDVDWDAGEYILWLPRDRNHKAYAVEILKLMVNGEEWEPEFRGGIAHRVHAAAGELQARSIAERYAVNQFEIHMVVRLEDPPGANLLAVGGSELTEASLFNLNDV